MSNSAITGRWSPVTINVTPVNDAPIARDDSYRVVIDTQLEVDVENGLLSNDTDVDNDDNDLTVQVVEDAATGMLDVAPNGSFTYALGAGTVAVRRSAAVEVQAQAE